MPSAFAHRWRSSGDEGRLRVMTHLAFELAAVLYLGAAVYGFSRRRAGAPGPYVVWGLGLGATLQAGGMFALHLQTPPVPLESFPAALAVVGWLIAAGFLASLVFVRVRSTGPWVAVLAALFTLLADAGLWLSIATEPPADSVSSAWSHAHVLLSMAGFAVLALASLAGLGYLAKERELKRKTPSRIALPSLESLDRAEHATLSVGFALLTLGVITGFVWGVVRGSPWSVHSLFLILAWLVYLIPVGLRVVQREHGSRPARRVVLGFAFLAFSYIGIRLLGAAA